jgi:hypothetical protein
MSTTSTARRPAPRNRPPQRRPRVRTGRILLLVVLLSAAIVAVPIWHALQPKKESAAVCSTTGSATQTSAVSYTLTPTQAANAATIAAVGRRDGLPDHAVTIALATALQESKLVNLTYGDRDSVGLFQQRPSMGWGTPQQLQDPVYAAHAFYARLVTVRGWQTAAVTAAAQAVQRSGAPYAYADWEPEARALARAFTGESAAGFTCLSIPSSAGVTNVRTLADRELGRQLSATPTSAASGWADATWLVAHAAQLGLESVSFDGSTWLRSRGTWAASGANGATLQYRTA